MVKGENCSVQQQQRNETSQASETTCDLISITSEGRDIMFNATFMAKSAFVRHFSKATAAQSVKIRCRIRCA